jgi:hypothetical protein
LGANLKKVFKYLGKAVKWLFIVFFIFIGTLFFREQDLPVQWLCSKTEEQLGQDFVFSCQRVTIGFRNGLRIVNLKIFNKKSDNPLKPFVMLESLSLNPFNRKISAVGFNYARLPDSYYKPGWTEHNKEVKLNFPPLGKVDIELIRPHILGLVPHKVTAQANIAECLVDISDINIHWPEKGYSIAITGDFKLDGEKGKIESNVLGRAFPSQIRPLLVALDIPSALPYFDGFSGITKPVDAAGFFGVDLATCDFTMKLDLKTNLGAYNSVPMSYAEGTLDLFSYVRGTNSNVKFEVTLPIALDREGRKLGGKLSIDYINDVTRLKYDVKSNLKLDDALNIADFIEPSSIGPIKCVTHPDVVVKGQTGTSAEDSGYNDLNVYAKVEKAKFFDLDLYQVASDFVLRGDTLHFRKINAHGKNGGKISAIVSLRMPEFDENKISIKASVDYKEGSLDELFDLFNIKASDKRGKVSGSFDFTAPASEDFFTKLNGSGKIKVEEGHLGQLKMFAGLTELFAEHVPGVAFLVNQTEASADFSITNGVLYSNNLLIEGGAISITGKGSYDIAKDDLNLDISVKFAKKDSITGMIVRPITWPISKLFLEFKATGSASDPKWTYETLLEKIL